MPTISIIVPVYNTEKYLHRCIDSILAQTFTDFELLLINDGSKDKSGEICDEYLNKDSRVRVYHKENGGVSSARNIGLENALGEWITFVDADDWIEDSMLEEVTDAAKKNNADLVFVDINICYSHKVNQYYKTYRWIGKPQNALVDYLKQSKLRPGWGLIKSSIVKKYNYIFPVHLTIYEDMYMMIRLIYHSRVIVNVEKPLYNYYMQSSSIVHTTQHERIFKDQSWTYNAIFHFFHENGVYDLYALSLYDRILHDYQHWALEPALQSKFQEIYPDKKHYIWRSSTINLKLKFIMWCLTHNLYYIAHFLCIIRNSILKFLHEKSFRFL